MRYRLAHGWHLEDGAGLGPERIRQFLRPAVRAVPGSLARRLGPCRITVLPSLGGPSIRSRWSRGPEALEVSLAAEESEPHELTLELLLCVGQVLWEVSPQDHPGWLALLDQEFREGVSGEIDEDVLALKRTLLSRPFAARSLRWTERYAAAAFAATVAAYIHALWHDVTVSEGPEHLPAAALLRRLEYLAHRYPPDRGHRLFPPKRTHTRSRE
jgi:hypothetical protein